MNKSEIIAQLKAQYMVLTKQVNDEIIELNQDEYEATIDAWANFELTKFEKAAEAKAKAEAKATLLARLSITEDEAKLLLS